MAVLQAENANLRQDASEDGMKNATQFEAVQAQFGIALLLLLSVCTYLINNIY